MKNLDKRIVKVGKIGKKREKYVNIFALSFFFANGKTSAKGRDKRGDNEDSPSASFEISKR